MRRSKKPTAPEKSDTTTQDEPPTHIPSSSEIASSVRKVAGAISEEEPTLSGLPENVTEMGRYETTDLGLLISGTFTFEQWRSLGGALRGMRENVFWWLGDWWLHGERSYGEMASQEAQDEIERETGYTYHTVRTAAYVCDRIPFPQRHSGVSFKHHQVVAPIDSVETRDELLREARKENWTVAQLEDAARPFKASSRTKKSQAGLFDDDKFSILYADPAWKFQNTTTPSRKVEKEYPTMKTVDICALRDASSRPVQDIIAKNAVLFLWTPPAKNEEAMQVIAAWGFEYQTQLVWDKERQGLGHYGRNQHELLLIATHGSPGTPKPKDRPPSVLTVPRLRRWLGLKAQKVAKKLKHSEKPAEFRLLIERMYRKGVRLELFARDRVDGWSAWGNEVPEAEETKATKRKKSAA
jgi:N6-adenosine-specific RNA methylase IME4